MTNYKEYAAGGRPPRPHWQQGTGQHYGQDRCTRHNALSLPMENSSAVAVTKADDDSYDRDQAHASTLAATLITLAPHVKGKVEYYTNYASDCVLGFNIQPSILKRLPNAAIAPGRVSAHILRMLCDKEHQIRAFEARQLRTMEAEFKLSDGRLLIAQLLEADGFRINELGMMSKEQRQALPVRIQQAVFKVHQAGVRSARCLVLCTMDGALKYRIPATQTNPSCPHHPYVSQLKVGQTVTGLQMRAPPPRYTVASIAIAIVKAGLGGVSSNAATVSKLVKEGMLKIKEEGGLVIPTPEGMCLAKRLAQLFITYTSHAFPDSVKTQYNLLAGSVKSGPEALDKAWRELIGTYRTLRDVKMQAACSLLDKVLRQHVFVSPANGACPTNSNGQPQPTLAKSKPTINSSSDTDRSLTIKQGTSTAVPCTTPQSVQIATSDIAPQSACHATCSHTPLQPACIVTINTAQQSAQIDNPNMAQQPPNCAAPVTAQLDMNAVTSTTMDQDTDMTSSDNSDDDLNTAPSDTDEQDSDTSLSDEAEQDGSMDPYGLTQQNVRSDVSKRCVNMSDPSSAVSSSKLYTNRPTRAMPSEQPQVAFSYELGGIKLEITEDLSVSVSITPTMTGILTTIGAIGTIGFALWRRRR